MRRAALLALVVVCVQPLAAADKHIGFGDSLTAGTSWPAACGTCPSIFDCTGGCNHDTGTNREKCGYVRRLENWLGAGHDVLNRGVGGEDTLEGVTRIDNVLDGQCGTPGDCVSVLLMEGTNDLNNNVMPEVAAANLETIAGKVKARNIDVVLMTTPRKVFRESNKNWKTYKNLVLGIATDEDLVPVNVWETLCPNDSCFNLNYWVTTSTGTVCAGPYDDALGHLDPDGYDVMTDLIKPVFPASPPSAPSTSAPSGDITDTTPDFVWPHVSAARWYELDVDGALSWWEAAAHCSGGTCTVDPGVTLATGAHSWRVRGRNLRGKGSYSAPRAFTIWNVPSVPSTSAPAGDFYDSDPMTAPFPWEPYTWNESSGATSYDLEVSDLGGVVLAQSFTSSICSASVCSASPAAGLAAAAHTFRVRAINPAAASAWSAGLGFQIYDSVPGAPTTYYPVGELFQSQPLYEWQELSNSTNYHLEVEDETMSVVVTDTFAASAVCIAGRCSIREGTTLAPGEHTWRVTASNPVGDGSPSVDQVFTLLDCPSSAPVPVTGNPITGTVTEQHCGVIQVANGGDYVVDPAADVTFHSRDGVEFYDGTSLAGTVATVVDK